MSTSSVKFGKISGEHANDRGVTTILVPYLILIGSQVPLTFVYFLNLAGSRPHYSLFPLALFVFAALMAMRWPRAGEVPYFPSVFSLVLLALGLVLAVCGTLWLSPWFGFAALMAFLGSLLARTNDHGRFGTLISLLAPLLVLLQPPAGIDFDNVQGDIQLMQWINESATSLVSDVFDMMGAPPLDFGYVNLVHGSNIEVPGGQLDAIDFGTRGSSVFTLLIATAIYIAVMRRPAFRGLVLLLACVFWAVFGETMQLAICTMGAVSFNMDWLGDNAPSSLRVICLLTALLLTVLTDHLITFLFGKVDMTSIDEDQTFQYWLCQSWNFLIAGYESPVIDNNVRREVNWARWRNSAPSANVSRALWISAIACAALAVFQVIEIGRASSIAGDHALESADQGWIELAYSAMPDSLGGADLVATGFSQPPRRTAFRVRENVWTYRDPGPDGINYEITVSQAWPGWHDSVRGQERLQWIPVSTSPVPQTLSSGVIPGMPVVVADFYNTFADYRFMASCQFDAFGEPFEPPLMWNDFADFWRRAGNRMKYRIRPRLLVPDAIAIQVTVQTVGPVPESLRRRASQLLEEAAFEIHRQIVDGSLPVDSDSPEANDQAVNSPEFRQKNRLNQRFIQMARSHTDR